ncbi:MAG: TPM domain-containing protein, partial [Gemmatimonadaceae bacterium]|nr:TPM domain-containing protein [Gemmatimonadaceae bacterium]
MQAIGVWMLLQAPQIPGPPRGFGTNEADIVVDAANVLSSANIALVNRVAFDVRAKSGGEIAVVTLPDIGDRDAAMVALEIGRQWKVGRLAEIGDQSRNAGAVILLVPKETNSDGRGRCYISTGQGVEGFITDAASGTICRSVTPLFMQRDYGTAVEQIALQVGQLFAREFSFSLDTTLAASAIQIPEQPARGRRSSGFPPQLIFFLVLLFFALSSFRRRGRRRGCGGGLPLIIPFPIGGGHQRGGGWG